MAVKLSPVASQFQVNQALLGLAGIANEQTFPDIVPLADGRFVVVYESWFDNAGNDIDIHAHFVNPDGTLSGATIGIATPAGIQQEPEVAARGDGGFTTIWQDSGTTPGSPSADPDIYYAVTNAAGAVTVSRTLLMNSAFVLQNSDIATLPDLRQIVVAERIVGGGNFDIQFDVLAADGTTQLFAGGGFGNVDVSAGFQGSPRVAAGPNRALVVYEDNTGEANPNEHHIVARLFDGTTNTFGSAVLIADPGAGHSESRPDVAYIGGGRFAIVYDLDLTGIFARIYNSDTGALSPEIAVSTAAAMLMVEPRVAATPDGGFVVTWNDFAGPAPDAVGESVHARRFDPYGSPFGDDFVVNTLTDSDQFFPVIGIGGSGVLTAWSDFANRPGDASPSSVQAQAFSAPVFDYDSGGYGDFDNNGRSDFLFQNLVTGAVSIWTTDSGGVAGSITTPGFLPAGYKVDGTGNFNGTPGDDILLRSSGGQVAVWVTNGAAIADFKVLGSTSPQFLNAGIGDFTGDGQSDVLFRNVVTNEIASWQIVNNALAAPPKVLGSASPIFQIVAVADFNGDKQADILFRNLTNGEIAEWQIAGNALVAAPQVVGSTSTSYHVVGTGDFDGNGANDILFRHDNGELVVWLLNSAGQLLSAPQVAGTASGIYHIDGTGDLNGDGRSDIVFRDPEGTAVEWLMSGATPQAIQIVGTASQDFSVAAHHFELI